MKAEYFIIAGMGIIILVLLNRKTPCVSSTFTPGAPVASDTAIVKVLPVCGVNEIWDQSQGQCIASVPSF